MSESYELWLILFPWYAPSSSRGWWSQDSGRSGLRLTYLKNMIGDKKKHCAWTILWDGLVAWIDLDTDDYTSRVEAYIAWWSHKWLDHISTLELQKKVDVCTPGLKMQKKWNVGFINHYKKHFGLIKGNVTNENKKIKKNLK